MTVSKPRARIVWLLPVFCAFTASANLVRWLQAQRTTPSFYDLVEALGWSFFGPIFLAFLASLIISRQPHNRVGWLLALPALFSATPVTSILAAMTEPPSQLTVTLWFLLWLDGWSWIPAIFPIFLIFLHFPTGRPPSPRWRWVNWLAVGLWLFFMAGSGLLNQIGPLNGAWSVRNPVGIIEYEAFEDIFLIFWFVGLITMLAASVISLFVRYRKARNVERQQIKWLLYAGAMFVCVYTFSYFISDTTLFANSGLYNLFFFLAIYSIPLSVALAILRYRLWDIDVIIRRTLLYSALTALLGLIYFSSVIFLQNIILALSGEQSAISIVLSTLLIAALFTPLRRRLQAAIDRRFFRSKYDVQQTLAQFAHTARDEVDLDQLSAALLNAVHSTVQPRQATLWLAQPHEQDA